MTVVFAEATAKQCRRPVEGSGMYMTICGAPTAPAKSYCPDCRALLYYKPTKTELKTMDAVYGAPIKAKG